MTKEAQKKWKDANKEAIKEYNKKYRQENREKVLELQKAWREDNKEHRKEYAKDYLTKRPDYFVNKHLEYSYGITLDDFNAMREKANYSCQGCGKHEKDTPRKRLFVDHCHTTGAIRGLLCQQCNTALGMANDNPEILASLISYLRENNIERTSDGS